MKLNRTPIQAGFTLACLFTLGDAFGQTPPAEAADPGAELRRGKNFIPTEAYSPEEDKRLLGFFDGLRVADRHRANERRDPPALERRGQFLAPLY